MTVVSKYGNWIVKTYDLCFNFKFKSVFSSNGLYNDEQKLLQSFIYVYYIVLKNSSKKKWTKIIISETIFYFDQFIKFQIIWTTFEKIMITFNTHIS
jgi:hypothetical protein